MPEIQITMDDLLKKIGALSMQVDVLQNVNQGLAKENATFRKEQETTKTKPEKGK